jgi:glycosyltransferase involved in cell wall biosynthesis
MSAQTAQDLAEALTGRGHQVTVLTSFPNRPAGTLTAGMKRRWRLSERRDGYAVIHCWHTLSRKSTLGSRFLENLSFGVTSALQLLSAGRFDVAYVNTWPILSQGLAIAVLNGKRIPVVCAVQDIYPETLTNKGLMSANGALARLMSRLDAWTLSRCAAVTTLSEGMREFLLVGRALSPSRVFMIPNWVEESLFPGDAPKYGSFRKSLGLSPDAFVAVFAGSLTMSAGVSLYVNAARILAQRGRKDIKILLVGDGSMRMQLETDIAASGLTNIRTVHPLELKNVPEVQAAADVLLLALTGTSTSNAAPSKQVSYMFSERPILASVSASSPAAELVRLSRSGFVVPPDDPEAVATELCRLADDPSQLSVLGKNAREYAEANFSRNGVLPRLVELLEAAGGGSEYTVTRKQTSATTSEALASTGCTHSMTVRPAIPGDIDALVELHCTSFSPSQHVPMMLGKRYVRAAYRWQVTSKEAYTLVAESDGRIVGAVSVCDGPFTARMFRACLSQLLSAVVGRPSLLFEESLWKRLVRRSRRREDRDRGLLGQPNVAQMVIGVVHRDYRGGGVFDALVEQTRGTSSSRGSVAICAGVYKNNTSCRRVFVKSGWVESRALETSDTVVYVASRESLSGHGSASPQSSIQGFGPSDGRNVAEG